jgi:hypothetical protein
MKIHEHNATTGEVIERDATAEELANAEASRIAYEARRLEQEKKELTRQAVYEKLGLTPDEVAALLG